MLIIKIDFNQKSIEYLQSVERQSLLNEIKKLAEEVNSLQEGERKIRRECKLIKHLIKTKLK